MPTAERWIEMPEAEYIYFKCLEVQQPIGSFYVGAMPFGQVTFISYADVRRIEARDVERYIGIQRPLEGARVKELRNYVTTIDSSFPTSVILAVNGADALYDPEGGIMRLRKDLGMIGDMVPITPALPHRVSHSLS
jgi:DGQHR domain-containing protein